LENWTPFPKPTVCPNPVTPACNSHNFKVLDMGKEADCRDYQEIKIQEQVHQLGVGSLPRFVSFGKQNPEGKKIIIMMMLMMNE
jgi:DNA replicative helicase MCM subunit Mcm2 (Cdc46/Mcm family)